MSTPQLILQALFFVINSFALYLVVHSVCKMYKRMNDKLDQYLSFTKHVSDRNDIVYINQLETLKCELAKSERYEEAQMVSKILESEFKRLKYNEHKSK